jgi:hypothetical protein
MENFNWLMAELLVEQRERLLAAQSAHVLDPPPQEHGGVKHALATKLVRLGLRLDPAAGEGLGPRELALAGRDGRR